MSIRAQITQKELSNVGLQKNLGILVNSNPKRSDNTEKNAKCPSKCCNRLVGTLQTFLQLPQNWTLMNE